MVESAKTQRKEKQQSKDFKYPRKFILINAEPILTYYVEEEGYTAQIKN